MGKWKPFFTGMLFAATSVLGATEPFGGTLVWPCGGELFEACPGSLSELRDRFRKDVFERASEEAYRGKIRLHERSDVAGAVPSETQLAEVPICALQALPVNQCREEREQNHLKEECGPWSELHYVNPPRVLHTLRVSRGHRETAWASGVFISFLQESALKIQNEISENRFALDPASPCWAPAADWHLLVQRVRTSEVVGTLRGCRDKGLASCTTGNQMVAVLESLRTAYLQVTRCRLYAEAMRAQREFSREFLDRVDRAVIQPCVQTSQGDPESLQRCYLGRMPRWMGDDLKKRFPLSAAACLGGGA